MEQKILRAKSLHILKENEDILKFIIDSEIHSISKTKIEAENEFDLVKKYYHNQGIIDGMRRFMQKLNEYASKDI